MADVTAGLRLSARDTEALAAIRDGSAGWSQPLGDAEIVRAAVLMAADGWIQMPADAPQGGRGPGCGGFHPTRAFASRGVCREAIRHAARTARA